MKLNQVSQDLFHEDIGSELKLDLHPFKKKNDLHHSDRKVLRSGDEGTC